MTSQENHAINHACGVFTIVVLEAGTIYSNMAERITVYSMVEPCPECYALKKIMGNKYAQSIKCFEEDIQDVCNALGKSIKIDVLTDERRELMEFHPNKEEVTPYGAYVNTALIYYKRWDITRIERLLWKKLQESKNIYTCIDKYRNLLRLSSIKTKKIDGFFSETEYWEGASDGLELVYGDDTITVSEPSK